MKRFLHALTFCLLPTAAFAWTHGITTPTPTAPVLQNVAVNFGADTPTGRGGVFLNSMDINAYAAPGYGLDLETTQGTPCVTYTQTLQSGTSGHLTLIAANTPVATAKTPVPTSAGQTAHLNGGPYVISTTCKDANGNVSNTATLTYNIVAKHATYGQSDSSTGIVQAGFGATSGYVIDIATGFQHFASRTVMQNISCATLCAINWADPARPGLLISLELSGTMSNIDVNGLTCAGNPAAATSAGAPNACYYISSTTNGVQFHNNTGYFSISQIAATGSNGWAFFRTEGPNAVIGDLTNGGNTCYNCQSGFFIRNGSDNISIVNNNIRGWGSDCMFLENPANITFTDNLCAAPFVVKVGVHVDSFQIGGGATPPGMTIKRNMFVGAEGNSITQGPIFNLTLLSGTGYISTGSGSSSPGKHLTLVTGSLGTNAAGSQIYGPSGPLSSDNALITTRTSSTSADLNLAANVSIGTPASPVAFYSYGLKDLVMDGNIFMSATTNGYDIGYEQGTSSFGHFGYASQVPGAPYATNFQGTITGTTTLTATNVNGIVGIESGDAISFPGCVSCTNGALKATGTNCPNGGGPCVFTLNAAQTNQGPIAMTASPAPPWQGVNPAIIKQENSTTAALHGGTFARSAGWSQSGITEIPGPGNPANTTDTNVFSGATTSGAAAFANGDPQTQAEAISVATYQGMTNAQLRAQYCHIWLPKAAGPLDGGGGTYYAPVKLVAGAGQWFDGTPISGCS